MATENAKSKTSTISFFDENAKIEESKKIEERRKVFKIMALVSIGVAVPVASYKYISDKRMENFIEDVLSFNKTIDVNKVTQSLDGYAKIVNTKNIENVTSLNKFNEYKDLAKVFSIPINISNIDRQRDISYKESMVELQQIRESLTALLAIDNKEKLLKSLDINEDKVRSDFSKVSNFIEANKNPESNVAIYPLFKKMKELDNNKKNIDQAMEQLASIKEEVVGTVITKISKGDYNLNESQKALVEDIKENTNKQVKDLMNLRKELSGTDFENEFTNNDVTEAAISLKKLEDSIVDKVVEDKKQIENLIEQVSKNELKTSPESIKEIASNTNSNSTGNQWGFFEYYLLYNWLAGGSSSTPGMVASHTSSFAATSGKNLTKTPNGAYVPPVTINKSAVNNIARSASAPVNNMYNTANPNSYINSSVEKMKPKQGISPKELKQKVEKVKAKGNLATSNRRAAIARSEAAARARREKSYSSGNSKPYSSSSTRSSSSRSSSSRRR